MSIWAELLAFMGILALGQFSPGPDMLLLTQTSLSEGRRAGWLTMLGIVTGLALHATIAMTGVVAVLQNGIWWERALRIAAAAYLGWLGYRILMEAFLLKYSVVKYEVELAADASAPRRWYVQGLLCNVLNPKVAIFFVGILAQFLDGSHPVWWPYTLWLILIVEGMVLWGIWVAVLQQAKVREFYRRYAVLINGGFGVSLLVVAVLVLL